MAGHDSLISQIGAPSEALCRPEEGMGPRWKPALRAVGGPGGGKVVEGGPHSVLLEIFTDEGYGTMVVEHE